MRRNTKAEEKKWHVRNRTNDAICRALARAKEVGYTKDYDIAVCIIVEMENSGLKLTLPKEK